MSELIPYTRRTEPTFTGNPTLATLLAFVVRVVTWIKLELMSLEQSVGRYRVLSGERGVKDLRYPPGNIRRYGAVERSNCAPALQQAIDNASTVAGVPVWRVIIPKGDWLASSGVTCAFDRTHIACEEGPYVATITFNPSVTSGTQVLFTFNKGTGTTIVQPTIRNLSFRTDDATTKKVLFDLVDVSSPIIENVTCIAWTGNKSTGLRTSGRDLARFRDIQIYADRPIHIQGNPNYPALPCDHFHASNYELVCLDAAEAVVWIDDDTGFSVRNLTFDGRGAMAGGLDCFRATPSAPASTAANIVIRNARYESPLGNGGWFLNWTGKANLITLDNVCMGGVNATPSNNGVKARNIRGLKIRDSFYTGPSQSALDWDGANCNDLFLDNFYAIETSTVTIASAKPVVEIQKVSSTCPVPAYAIYQSTTLGDFLGPKINGTQLDLGEGTLATGGLAVLPFSASGVYKTAFVTAWARDATTPLQLAGFWIVTPDGSTNIVGVNAGDGTTANKLCVDFISASDVRLYNGRANTISYGWLISWTRT